MREGSLEMTDAAEVKLSTENKDRFPYPEVETQQEETLHGVCTWMVRVTDRGKSPPTPFQNMAAGVGADLPV